MSENLSAQAGTEGAQRERDRVRTVSKRQSDMLMPEIKERFKQCEEFEAYTRPINLDDRRFYHGDAENLFQWPRGVLQDRGEKRPRITINKTQHHVALIINDQKQNKTSIKYRATGFGATAQSAQINQALARHVMAQSNFEDIMDKACEFQVVEGMAYWRVVTDYVSPDSFEQEIYIRPIKDPRMVYLDPNISADDGSDARFGFIFSDVPRSLFEAEYPAYRNLLSYSNTLGSDFQNMWYDKHIVRVAEYYRLSEEQDELIEYEVEDGSGERRAVRASKLPRKLVEQLKQMPTSRVREITTNKCEWFKIVGGRVIKRGDWPGAYIPIVRVPGIESIIDGRYDRRGHVRMLKDPQRVYNYYSSAGVETVALQSRTPYMASAKAIEGYEALWASANIDNPSVLVYNSYDDEGNKLEMPQRIEGPRMPEAVVQGLMIASNEMMSVSGQYPAQLGKDEQEVSGVAIAKRQQQGDTSTYHFISKLSMAIRHTGVILLDLFPKVYDTERVIQIVGEDGTESAVKIDPMLDSASVGLFGENVPEKEAQKMRRRGMVEFALNPAIGRYAVSVDVGPSYNTQRQEAWNALSQIITQNADLTAIIGDLALRSADFPLADEAAERLRRMVPAQALGDAPSPEVTALQQQVQNLTSSLAAAIQALGDKAADVKRDQEKVQVEVYKAETDRLKTMLDQLNPEALRALITTTVVEALSTSLQDVKRTTEAFLAPPELPPNIPAELGQPEPEPSTPGPLADQVAQELDQSLIEANAMPAGDANNVLAGMRQAPDGKWYLPDPQRPGQYLEVSKG
jgi:hypothetical protein